MSADAPVALSLFAPEPEPAPAGPAARIVHAEAQRFHAWRAAALSPAA